MDIKVKTDTRFILSLTEDEMLKLIDFLDHSKVITDVSSFRTYDNDELEMFAYELSRDISRSAEDKLSTDW